MSISFAKNLKLFTIVGLVALNACDISASKDEGDSGSSGITPTLGTNTAAQSSRLQCGIVVNDNLETNVEDLRAEQVSVSPISSDIVAVTYLSGDDEGQQQLVKLHGVSSRGVSSFLVRKGIDLIAERVSSIGFYVPAGRDCDVTTAGGGAGVLGQIFTANGESISELLLAAGAVVPQIEACGAELLYGCYNSIDVEEEVSSSLIRSFLWKPVAERDGNLVVLVNPFNVTIRVTGASTETLVDYGPTNGRGTTSRGAKPGCAYGNGVKVEFFDPANRRILMADGSGSITVPRGCDRFEREF